MVNLIELEKAPWCNTSMQHSNFAEKPRWIWQNVSRVGHNPHSHTPSTPHTHTPHKHTQPQHAHNSSKYWCINTFTHISTTTSINDNNLYCPHLDMNCNFPSAGLARNMMSHWMERTCGRAVKAGLVGCDKRGTHVRLVRVWWSRWEIALFEKRKKRRR